MTTYLDWDITTNRAQRRRRYSLLDGIDSQAGSSKPTLRSDGTTLQTGDRWLDTGDRQWWHWNSTYWLSEQLHWFDAPYPLTISASSFPGGFCPNPSYNLYLLDFTFTGRFVMGMYDSSNYWRARIVRDSDGTNVSGTQIAAITTLQSIILADEIHSYASAVNLHLSVAALSISRIRLDAVKTGLPPNISNLGSRITYRLVKP